MVSIAPVLEAFHDLLDIDQLSSYWRDKAPVRSVALGEDAEPPDRLNRAAR
jgi:hypothetical protein